LPQFNTPAQVLGCLYVIEGATLGGQIISKHLLANLGLGPDTGAAFFNGYGAESGHQWQSFRLFLTGNAEAMDQDDEIVFSANDTFKTLGQWLFPNSTRKLVAEHTRETSITK
jgi:heme oxygenase